MFVSFRLIFQHMAHFTHPIIQSKVVGILWMTPIYAFDSWVSLRFKDWAIYFDMLRDCYEGYVLYLFLALLIAYVGRGNEFEVVRACEAAPRVEHVFPFNLMFRGPVPHGKSFLRWCKFGTLQYSALKPVTTVFAVLMRLVGRYHEGDFNPTYGWVYVTTITNFSVIWAFYCLGMFYVVLKKSLAPFDPVPKFLCVKMVLFLSFWQSVVIAGLVKLGIITDLGAWTSENIAVGLQDLLICVEMMLIAFFHTRAFSWHPFSEGRAQHSSRFLEDHFAHYTAIKDFNEVMPILLPTNFKPGPIDSMHRPLVDPPLSRGNSLHPTKVRSPPDSPTSADEAGTGAPDILESYLDTSKLG
eukprot:CAMPEP_0113936620 /NCGR_PEP_ID=MMETSP1339-20121228/3489_1 /TAXON_ID=94617 /ORGANISM="Fibrocapsa japonica" /LENGTH=354 /DNA_ID=CAMNT_0000939151 /DNA_START=181 /DNA_END=1245 /DNA_ORIENTATION=- /assembly_acc=CAM_ASM_000762